MANLHEALTSIFNFISEKSQRKGDPSQFKAVYKYIQGTSDGRYKEFRERPDDIFVVMHESDHVDAQGWYLVMRPYEAQGTHCEHTTSNHWSVDYTAVRGFRSGFVLGLRNPSKKPIFING